MPVNTCIHFVTNIFYKNLPELSSDSDSGARPCSGAQLRMVSQCCPE